MAQEYLQLDVFFTSNGLVATTDSRTLAVLAAIFKLVPFVGAAANITSAISQKRGPECIAIHDFTAAFVTGGVVPAGAPSCQDSVCQEGHQAEGQGEADRCLHEKGVVIHCSKRCKHMIAGF